MYVPTISSPLEIGTISDDDQDKEEWKMIQLQKLLIISYLIYDSILRAMLILIKSKVSHICRRVRFISGHRNTIITWSSHHGIIITEVVKIGQSRTQSFQQLLALSHC